jgi:hypothetical protein
MDDLISALDAIRTAACIDASCRLRASLLGATTFDLHLRDASLGIQDAFSLAKAIQNISGKPKLRSFSASYNPTLTDLGVKALTEAFPPSMSELGLVRCNIGDVGGQAILAWARRAKNPGMICIEQNQLSSSLRQEFQAFSSACPDLLLVI